MSNTSKTFSASDVRKLIAFRKAFHKLVQRAYRDMDALERAYGAAIVASAREDEEQGLSESEFAGHCALGLLDRPDMAFQWAETYALRALQAQPPIEGKTLREMQMGDES